MFLKSHPVIHFGILHFKNKETLFYSVGPISQYSPQQLSKSAQEKFSHQISSPFSNSMDQNTGIKTLLIHLRCNFTWQNRGNYPFEMTELQ